VGVSRANAKPRSPPCPESSLPPTPAQLLDDAPVLLDERVHSVHLSSNHAAAQLIERLVWAIGDAEHAEGAQTEERVRALPAPAATSAQAPSAAAFT
jgi:hypothetical protein